MAFYAIFGLAFKNVGLCTCVCVCVQYMSNQFKSQLPSPTDWDCPSCDVNFLPNLEDVPQGMS